jgi:hypothetical protein
MHNVWETESGDEVFLHFGWLLSTSLFHLKINPIIFYFTDHHTRCSVFADTSFYVREPKSPLVLDAHSLLRLGDHRT